MRRILRSFFTEPSEEEHILEQYRYYFDLLEKKDYPEAILTDLRILGDMKYINRVRDKSLPPLPFNRLVRAFRDRMMHNYEARSNRELMLFYIGIDEDCYLLTDITLQSDRAFALQAVEANVAVLRHTPHVLDKEFILDAMRINGLGLRFINNPQFNQDDEVLEAAYTQTHEALRFFPDNKARNFVLRYFRLLRFAEFHLKHDRDFVLSLVQSQWENKTPTQSIIDDLNFIYDEEDELKDELIRILQAWDGADTLAFMSAVPRRDPESEEKKKHRISQVGKSLRLMQERQVPEIAGEPAVPSEGEMRSHGMKSLTPEALYLINTYLAQRESRLPIKRAGTRKKRAKKRQT